MALTVCLRCDKTYGDWKSQCPHCGTHNFFADEDTLVPAVDVLCAEVYHKAAVEKAAKLAELQEVKEELLPHTVPLWKQLLREHRENIIVLGVIGIVALAFFCCQIAALMPILSLGPKGRASGLVPQ